jgi:vacuolar protein sorting-associated protein 13A/C
MHVWSVSCDATDTEIAKLADGQDMNWRFDDWRKTREVSIIILLIMIILLLLRSC